MVLSNTLRVQWGAGNIFLQNFNYNSLVEAISDRKERGRKSKFSKKGK